jgi:hypothetical protein
MGKEGIHKEVWWENLLRKVHLENRKGDGKSILR